MSVLNIHDTKVDILIKAIQNIAVFAKIYFIEDKVVIRPATWL